MDAGTRRRGREIALQVLYQADTQSHLTAEEALQLYGSHFARAFAETTDVSGEAPLTDEQQRVARDLATRIVRGVVGRRDDLDALLQRASRNWRLDRMARVDRNLLRVGAWELSEATDVPAKVAINEAIEIAKRFGTAESPAFVNGILDRVLDELGRKDAPPVATTKKKRKA